MKKPKLFLLLMLCGIMPHLHGLELQQSITVSGVVVDKTDDPIPGAAIMIVGTTQGTSSDVDGKFSLPVPDENAVLQISFIGYQTQTQVVGSRRVFRIVLEEISTALEEVVVVAYGTQKKESITAAISTAKTADLKVSASPSIANSLAGRVSGLISYQGMGGQPGRDDATIYLRGVATSNGTEPLILIDGVPRDNIRTIDPNEVESVSVLKDASATAVFGVRGANGVLMITTRRGNKDQRPELSITATQSFQQLTREPERVHSLDYIRMRNEAFANDGLPTPFTPDIIAKYENPTAGLNPADPDYARQAAIRNFMYPDNDYYRLLINRWSPQTVVNANLIGGTDKISYFMNIGFRHQQGQLNTEPKEMLGYDPSSKLDRYSFRSNIDYQATSFLSFFLNVGTYIEIVNMPATGAMYENDQNWMMRDMYYMAQSIMPIAVGPYTIEGFEVEPGQLLEPAYLNSGKFADRSPFEIINYRGYEKETRANLNSSVGANLDLSFITPGLSMRGMMSFDSWSRTIIRGEQLAALYIANVNASIDELSFAEFRMNPERLRLVKTSLQSRYSINAQGSISYARKFGLHDVTGMFTAQRDYFENNNSGIILPYNYLGMAGRATYNFDGRYFAEINMGYNGSEQFSPQKRFGFFPAFSVGWAASNESFLINNPYLTYLKLRGSIGRTGNDKQGSTRFLYMDNITQGGGGPFTSISAGQTINEGLLGNLALTWEMAQKYNVGIDFQIMKSLRGSFDVFKENRTQILLSRNAVPTFQGIPLGNLPRVNMGEMENHGFEVELTYTKEVNKDLYVEARGNFGYNKNTRLVFDEVPKDDSYYYQYRTEGYSTGQHWGYLVNWDQDGGYWTPEALADPNRITYSFGTPRPGDLVYTDLNGNGVVDDGDMAPLGIGTIPRVTWGASTNLQYKGIDLYVFFQGLARFYGTYASQGTYETTVRGTFFPYHQTAWTQERWENGETITYPALSTLTNVNHRDNSFFVFDRSFARLRNIEIGYTVPKHLLRSIGVSRLRVYLSGQNLHSWSPNFRPSHLDPENNDSIGYPQTRTYSFGTNITF